METEKITTEVAIAQYKEILTKSEIVPEIDVTELASLAKRASEVVVSDITNEAQMSVAKTMRTELSQARIEISKNAKTARDVFTKINRGISSVETVLLGEFEAEENRLKGYELELKAKRLKDERTLMLPVRKERLAIIDVVVADADLVEMDDLTFSNFLSEKQEAVLIAKKKKEEEDAKIAAAAEQAKDAAEKAAKDAAAETARKHQAELDRVEADKAQVIKDAAEVASKHEAEKAATAKALVDAEVAAEAEAKKLSKERAYKKFLKDNSYDESTDMLERNDDTVTLYRLVATYIK